MVIKSFKMCNMMAFEIAIDTLPLIILHGVGWPAVLVENMIRDHRK